MGIICLPLASRREDQAAEEIRAFFEDELDESLALLVSTVPVRTGKMKRHVEVKARLTTGLYSLYSDATNESGKEYAPYVAKYSTALNGVLAASLARIREKTFEVPIRFGWGLETRPATDFIKVWRANHKLFFQLRELS